MRLSILNSWSLTPMTASFVKQAARAAALVTMLVGPLAAQQGGTGSDVSGPGGGGGGLGGAVAPIGIPTPPPSGPLSSAGSSAAANIVGLFASAGGVTVSNPAGGTVTVPAAAAQAISAVLSGGGAAAVANLSSVLTAGRVPPTEAQALATALGQLGASPNLTTLTAAIEAFNAAVNASSGTPSPALLGVRFALASLSR